MKEMNHGNINSFIGISFDNNKTHILWMYCPKGSLQDILENDDISLDSLFKRSLISDLASGSILLYLTFSLPNFIYIPVIS